MDHLQESTLDECGILLHCRKPDCTHKFLRDQWSRIQNHTLMIPGMREAANEVLKQDDLDQQGKLCRSEEGSERTFGVKRQAWLEPGDGSEGIELTG